jgi:hypothetical protein
LLFFRYIWKELSLGIDQLPANQTPRVKTSDELSRPESLDSLFRGIDAEKSKSIEVADQSAARVSGRRKMIDRRDSDGQSKLPLKEDRREADRRQKKPMPKTAAEKKLEQDELKLQQHRKKILLAGCEPVMSFNYDFLAMDDYPENSLVAAARRDRDYWLALCSVFASIFFFGLLGFVSAWIAGIACGLGFLSAIFAFSPVRRHFFSRPRLHDLLAKRKLVEFRALTHIRLLEGEDGLAWRCQKLHKYNANLSKKIFSGLYRFSKERQLLKVVRQRKHIRLYLLLMIEAQKAYKRLEKDYLENHFKHLEAGWDDNLSSQEAAKIEQALNMANPKSG